MMGSDGFLSTKHKLEIPTGTGPHTFSVFANLVSQRKMGFALTCLSGGLWDTREIWFNLATAEVEACPDDMTAAIQVYNQETVAKTRTGRAWMWAKDRVPWRMLDGLRPYLNRKGHVHHQNTWLRLSFTWEAKLGEGYSIKMLEPPIEKWSVSLPGKNDAWAPQVENHPCAKTETETCKT
jgi:hypothetical protein